MFVHDNWNRINTEITNERESLYKHYQEHPGTLNEDVELEHAEKRRTWFQHIFAVSIIYVLISISPIILNVCVRGNLLYTYCLITALHPKYHKRYIYVSRYTSFLLRIQLNKNIHNFFFICFPATNTGLHRYCATETERVWPNYEKVKIRDRISSQEKTEYCGNMISLHVYVLRNERKTSMAVLRDTGM